MLNSLIKGHEVKKQKKTKVMEEAQHEEDVVAMISELALVASVPNDNIWILDIGAMKYVIGNPKVLNQLCLGNELVFVQNANGHSYPNKERDALTWNWEKERDNQSETFWTYHA
jgi:hypothetical protein